MNATGAIELSEFDAQDIDTEEDWQVAELKFVNGELTYAHGVTSMRSD